jgi:hypothetical protein
MHGQLQAIPTPVVFCGGQASAVIALTVTRDSGVDDLSWTITDATGLTGFLVCRWRQGYFYPAVEGYLPVEDTVAPTVLSYAFTDMDTWDDYQIVGVAYGIRGPYSSIVRVPIQSPVLTAWVQSEDDGDLTFTHPWQEDPTGGLHYLIEVRNVTASIGWSGAGTVTYLESTVAFPDLDEALGAQPGDSDEIEVRMRAYNGTSYSEWSNVLSFTYAV